MPHLTKMIYSYITITYTNGGGRVVRRCWVNFQCRGVLLIWIIVGQGPIALAVGVGGGCLDIFSLIYHFSFLSPSLWETARYRLKYCLKGPLSPKQPTNQPTNNDHDHMTHVVKFDILTGHKEVGNLHFIQKIIFHCIFVENLCTFSTVNYKSIEFKVLFLNPEMNEGDNL